MVKVTLRIIIFGLAITSSIGAMDQSYESKDQERFASVQQELIHSRIKMRKIAMDDWPSADAMSSNIQNANKLHVFDPVLALLDLDKSIIKNRHEAPTNSSDVQAFSVDEPDDLSSDDEISDSFNEDEILRSKKKRKKSFSKKNFSLLDHAEKIKEEPLPQYKYLNPKTQTIGYFAHCQPNLDSWINGGGCGKNICTRNKKAILTNVGKHLTVAHEFSPEQIKMITGTVMHKHLENKADTKKGVTYNEPFPHYVFIKDGKKIVKGHCIKNSQNWLAGKGCGTTLTAHSQAQLFFVMRNRHLRSKKHNLSEEDINKISGIKKIGK